MLVDEREYSLEIHSLARYVNMIEVSTEVVENELDVLARKHERRPADVSREFYAIMSYYLEAKCK